MTNHIRKKFYDILKHYIQVEKRNSKNIEILKKRKKSILPSSLLTVQGNLLSEAVIGIEGIVFSQNSQKKTPVPEFLFE